ncbi:MAG: trehalose-phosphatase [Acidimicrobiales bacterium]|nr:trehalose-phosphatase [Acidimicrobiales bacterium]
MKLDRNLLLLIDRFKDTSQSAFVACDFDGTLSPIVEVPENAYLDEQLFDAFVANCRRFNKLAIVSGRKCSFLFEKIYPKYELLAEPPPIELFGLYGLEHQTLGNGISNDDNYPSISKDELLVKEALIDQVALLASNFAENENLIGVVEKKGSMLTLHWRRQPEAKESIEAFAQKIAASYKLELHYGKASVEIRPAGLPSKANVVRWLSKDLDGGCYIGDDIGDIAAFSELKAIRDSKVKPDFQALAVAIGSDETALEVIKEADIVLKGGAELIEFFELIGRNNQ